ncbi:MAG: hypothetical protein AB1782_00045 [Cyanobacteriota bacterium]
MFNNYELAITEHEIDDILENKSVEYKFDPFDAYENLHVNDKKALIHLIKAAMALNDVFLMQDHSKNLEIRSIIAKAELDGDKLASKLFKLFNIFNGIEGNDGLSKEPVRLFKDLKLASGKNVFPEDVKKEEIIEYLKNNIEDAPSLLSNDTVVRKENNNFVAYPYSIAFKNEYKEAAKELLLAAKNTTHKDFAKYLRYQAQALTSNDPEFAYKADKTWAGLTDSPLEFTIGRESYEDTLTGAIAEDKELNAILEENCITIKSKDFIGARVGIVDIKASQDLADYKNHLKALSKLMPLQEKYKQSVDQGDKEEIKQVLVDVDLVYLSGDYAALRPGITLAQNLPNDDKLAVQLNSGNRNVFHKQVRRTFDPERRQKMLDNLVEKELHIYYDNEADHLFTIGHELTHSLGPMSTLEGKDKKVSLGDGYGDVLEECKADVGSLVGIEYFVKIGKYSEELSKKVIVTWAVDQMPISEPKITQAHRVREVMQLNYFIENGAIVLTKGSKLNVNIDLMIPTAKKLLEEVIQIQLVGDPERAKAFVDKYRNWNDVLEYVSEVKKSLKPKPYKILTITLAEKLLSQ